MLSMLHYLPPSMDKILDNVYLGNEPASKDKKVLKEKGVTHILISAKYLVKHHPNDFIYHELPLDDFASQDLFPYIAEAVEFIKNSKIVYVHCAAGISRSASMVMAYLMIGKKMSLDNALNLVRKKRCIVSPNPGFISQLKKLDTMLQKKDFDIKNLGKSKFY